MDTRLSFFVTIHFSLLLFCFASSPPSFCHEKERSALLEFKKTFFNKTSCFRDYESKKFESWKLGAQSRNCCAWDGIECDKEKGYVIGVELSGTCLSGNINSNTTLFHLVHLQRLDLSSNDLEGQVPPEILRLNDLRSLDLSFNGGLKLRKPDLLDLMKSFTKLESLDLSLVDISAPIPNLLAYSSSLSSLTLIRCNLQGEFPLTIFEMSKLKFLDVSYNDQLSGHLPEFHSTSSLRSLNLSGTNFSGQLPSSLGQLSNLWWLALNSNKFTGEIPSSIVNLTQLRTLDLGSNHFSGHILPQLTNLTQLSVVDLSFNNFSGSIPIGMFSMLKNLSRLLLSFNKLSFVENFNKTYASPTKFLALGLASCNLNSFPTFLQHQDRLVWLDLSSNNISGEIPEWFLEMSIDYMYRLNLSSNSLTSSLGRPLYFKWKNLDRIDLRDNSLKGSVPIPSASVTYYFVSRNELSGNLPSQICELGAIEGLDLSKNNLTGALPQCFNNLSDTLSYLSLHDNNFIGEISPILGNRYCSLKMIDVSSNQFHGSLPRSLTRCYDLEFLNLGNNHIKDVFPSWLGSLKNLRVLILHCNKFHGAVGEPETVDDFPSLQIVDLSSNNFQSCLPSMYFESWQAMKFPTSYKEGYMEGALPIIFVLDVETPTLVTFDYTVTIFIKGLKISYPKIQNYLTFIDLASNNFSCGIPSTIESLVQVQYLNLSNNNLTGLVPSFLKALTQLQSLDLSQNKLYGKIPQELTQLTFLEKFNVSYNNLSGKIPMGRQFDTFTNDSYLGNMNLCGSPLSKKCRKIEVLPQQQLQPEVEESIEIDWRVVLMGYGSGLIISIIIGQRFAPKPARWMLKCFVRKAQI